MKYALFLGCTIPVRTMGYEQAVRRIAPELGIEIVDMPDFKCCGYPLKHIDWHTTMLLSARNLSMAEEAGLPIVTMCNACTGTLGEVDMELKASEHEREEVNKKLAELGREYRGTTSVTHFMRLVSEQIGDKLKEKVTNPLTGLKVAVHYGCHYVKPTKLFDNYYPELLDNPEQPGSMDKIVEMLGAVSVDYPTKKDCCGGGLQAVSVEMAKKMALKKMDQLAQMEEIDAVVVACPACALMYGNNQSDEREIPVIFLPQLIGLAMGISPDELGFELNPVSADELLERLGVI